MSGEPDAAGLPYPGMAEPSRRQLDEWAEVVETGYDALGSRYGDWASATPEDPHRSHWLECLAGSLQGGGHVLDIGCGPGVPSTRWLAERFRVVGVDLSEGQLALARAAVPAATFLRGDITAMDFEPGTFDAVVALFSLGHVPAARLGGLLTSTARWLRRGGLLLAAFPTVPGEGIQSDWLGVPMFFSGRTPEASRTLLEAAGFVLLDEEVVTTNEPDEGVVSFQWVLASV